MIFFHHPGIRKDDVTFPEKQLSFQKGKFPVTVAKETGQQGRALSILKAGVGAEVTNVYM